MADEQEQVSVAAPAEEAEVQEETETKSPAAVTTDLKRKLEDIKPDPQQQQQEHEEADSKASPKEEQQVLNSDEAPDAKKPRLDEEESDGSALENGHDKTVKPDAPEGENAEMTDSFNAEVENPQITNEAENPQANAEAENEQIKSENVDTEDVKDVTVDNAHLEKTETLPEGDAPKSSDETIKTEDVQQLPGDLQQSLPETQTVSRKMEVPNNKVGVLIGKNGDTIRTLQLNSGAKIQITRDQEADPLAATRPVELIGTLEHINKAEKLIKDVIAEADAGGSPSLVARGFGTVQATGAADQIQIQVPIEKVGMIIGRGGETIKNLQTRSGARIQLVPQHLSEGDQSKERTVRVTGDKKHIELARDMINEVMSQPNRPSHSSGYNQQGYRPRGSSGPPQWGARGPPGQVRGYDNQHRGMYPPQNPQYMPPAYGDYPQQNAPRRNFNGGWDQRHGHMNTAPPRGGYDYYGHGGHAADSSAHAPLSNPGSAPAHGAPPTHVNYNNYGQPQGPEYGQPAPYSQSAPSQQNYGHGNVNQVPAQPAYGGQGNAQPGGYQQVATQSGYGQQPYSKPPAYGMPPQGPQAYGPPRPGQPGDLPYQNPAYGQAAPSQQSNPYPSGGSTQPYPYTSAPPANDGYSQPQAYAAPAPAYPQPGAQAAPAYGQGQAAPGYGQGQAGAYGTYPQPAYGEQQVPNNTGYGYQAPDANYGTAPTSYGAPPTQPTYEQQPAQPGAYAAVPGTAPGYAKNLSPQPVYGQQYDSAQVYGAQH